MIENYYQKNRKYNLSLIDDLTYFKKTKVFKLEVYLISRSNNLMNKPIRALLLAGLEQG